MNFNSVTHWWSTVLVPTQKVPLAKWRRVLTGTAGVSIISILLGWLFITQLGMWGAILAILLSALLTFRMGATWREAVTVTLGSLVIIAAIDYFGWRIQLINLHGFWIGIPLFLAELLGAIHIIGQQLTLWPKPFLPIRTQTNPYTMPVYIFIPTVNEGVEVLRPTIQGALNARSRYLSHYPHAKVEIIVCNDGYVGEYDDWSNVEKLATAMGVDCITRTESGGMKAGNLEHARHAVGATGNSLVVIFDADQIPHPEFLLKTIPPFTDQQVGWVQTGQYYDNRDSAVAAWAHDQQKLFYQLLCPSKSARNAAFICGTNVVIRAQALDEIGGMPQDSVTEDFAASIELHGRWRSVFIPGKWASGIGPLDLKAYFKQQNRWARGTFGVLRSHWREIFLPWRGNLSGEQRFQYALACTHYLCGLRDLIYLIAPIAFLVTGIPAVMGSDINAFFQHFLPYFLATQLAFWVNAWGKTGLRGIVIGFASFPVLCAAFFQTITGRKTGFNVTAKTGTGDSSLQSVSIHLVFLIIGLLALVIGSRQTENVGSIAVSMIWIAYQSILLSATLWLAISNKPLAKRTRRHSRARTGYSTLATSLLKRTSGTAAVAVMLPLFLIVSVVVAREQFLPIPTAEHYEIAREDGTRFGLRLPVELLETRPSAIESALGSGSVGILGRTQEISDTLDTTWLEQVSSFNAIPWLTLLFTDPNSTVNFASLPAIANGLHDAEIVRWAQAIAHYGQPLLLTVLPHVDRNWSASSAVANGGIPSDVPRAWQHIQTVFDANGANNVAWVWAPANPMDDKRYAPSLEQIDAVLLSLIRFPDTDWGNPLQDLEALKTAYPQTPLLVEVSLAGPSDLNKVYLQAFADAVEQTPGLYGVIYQEGSPNPGATLEEHDNWSMLSDSATTDILKRIAHSM